MGSVVIRHAAAGVVATVVCAGLLSAQPASASTGEELSASEAAHLGRAQTARIANFVGRYSGSSQAVISLVFAAACFPWEALPVWFVEVLGW